MKRTSVFGTFLLSSVCITPAMAQIQPANGDTPIIVTATKREIPLQETPQSLHVLDADVLERLGSSDFQDYLRALPNVSYQSSGQGLNRITIRGVGASTVGITTVAPIGIYIDETPVSSGFFQPDLGLFDVTSVEILKGPQGTLYGEGSLGGTIRVNTRRPEFGEFNGSVRSTLGFIDEGGVEVGINGAVNVPLGDRVAFRVAGAFRDSGGFIDNVRTGSSDVDSIETTGLRAVASFEPVDDLRIDLSYFGLSKDGGSASFDNPGTPNLTLDALFDEDFTLDFDLFNGTIEYTGDGFDIVSSTTYFERTTERFFEEISFRPLFGAVLGNSDNFENDVTSEETFTHETRIVSNGDGPFSWLAGIFYRNRDLSSDTNVAVGLPSDPVSLSVFVEDLDLTYETIAAFAELSYDLSADLNLTVGARWFNDTVDGRAFFVAPGLAAVLGGAPPTSDEQVDIDDDGVLFRAALSYDITPDHLIYASFSQGQRTGNANSRQVFGAPPTFGPDSVDSYEVGLKTEWGDGAFLFNIAAFYTDWHDTQVFIATALPGVNFLANSNGAEILGFEIETLLRPTPDLTFGVNIGYQDATIDGTFTAGATTVPDGAPLRNSPQWTLGSNLEYRTSLNFLDGEGVFRADFIHVDDRAESFSSGRIAASYQKLDLSAGFETDDVRIVAFVRNVTNERIEISANAATTEGPILDQPRTIGIQVGFDF